jgi:ribosomal protein S6--L-glutamate ligase/gamma-F420-2:alpha-L-glutamate ligase
MKKKGWLLYESGDANINKWFIEKLKTDLEPYEVKLVYTDFIAQAYDLDQTEIADRMLNDMEEPAFIINRSRNADVAYRFEDRGIRVFNPAEVTKTGNDKDLSYRLAEKLGIAYMPYTTVDATFLAPLCGDCENRSIKGTKGYEVIRQTAQDYGYPLVLKPSDGHGGKHVFLLNNEDELQSSLQNILHTFKIRPYKKLILQRPCAVKGRDLRIYLVNNEIITGMLRYSVNDNDFRANFSLGAKASIHTPTREEAFIAREFAKTLPSDFIGIDLIYDAGGIPVFNEIEDAVGSRMIYTYTDIDIIRLFADHVRSSLES